MFDSLRDDANSTPFYEDEAVFNEAENVPAKPVKHAAGGRFLGLTPMQRFILSVLLLIAMCALGSMCLLITGRVSLF